MKTKTLTNLNVINDIYSYNDKVIFYAVNDKLKIDGYSTYCKEEIGSQCVRYKYNKIVLLLPERLSDNRVDKILSYMHTKEKEAKVLKTIITRVKDKPKCLFVEYSRRWARNSVAHSILITWLRFAIARFQDDMYKIENTDKRHIDSCSWLLDIIKKKGLRIFGTMQHTKYDVGMVSLMWKITKDDECEPGDLDGSLPTKGGAYAKLMDIYDGEKS